MKLQEVRESALALPVRSRRKLAEDLIYSLAATGRHESLESEADWITEAEARIDAFERGELETISLDSFIKHVRGTSYGNKARQGRSRRI
jgi:putative addiction module component (TIGR02574 family)